MLVLSYKNAGVLGRTKWPRIISVQDGLQFKGKDLSNFRTLESAIARLKFPKSKTRFRYVFILEEDVEIWEWIYESNLQT